MRDRRIQISLLLILALACLTPAAAVPPADEGCKVQKIDLPDPSNLPDGEHVIKEAHTEGGRFQARVTVRNKVASPPRFSIAGRPLREVSESSVPKNLRDCLNDAQRRAGAAAAHMPVGVARLTNAFAPAAYADTCKVVFVTCGRALDGTYYCVAKVCCGRTCAFGAN